MKKIKMMKTVVLALGLIFGITQVATAQACCQGGQAKHKAEMKDHSSPEAVKMKIKNFDEKVELDDSQKAKLIETMEGIAKKREALNKDENLSKENRELAMADINRAEEAMLKDILNEDQLKTWNETCAMDKSSCEMKGKASTEKKACCTASGK